MPLIFLITHDKLALLQTKALKRRVHGRQSYREPRLLKRGRHVPVEHGLGADDVNRKESVVREYPLQYGLLMDSCKGSRREAGSK